MYLTSNTSLSLSLGVRGLGVTGWSENSRGGNLCCKGTRYVRNGGPLYVYAVRTQRGRLVKGYSQRHVSYSVRCRRCARSPPNSSRCLLLATSPPAVCRCGPGRPPCPDRPPPRPARAGTTMHRVVLRLQHHRRRAALVHVNATMKFAIVPPQHVADEPVRAS